MGSRAYFHLPIHIPFLTHTYKHARTKNLFENSIYTNDFINNGRQVDVLTIGVNTWDDGYPSGGNYLSDYSGTDSDGDGIGDTPYIIDENNQDNYPLMESVIIPEFPTWTTLLLMLILPAVALAVYKRRLNTNNVLSDIKQENVS